MRLGCHDAPRHYSEAAFAIAGPRPAARSRAFAPAIESAPLLDACVHTDIHDLDLVPSHSSIETAEQYLPVRSHYTLGIRNALEAASPLPYDFVFLDCPPFLGAITTNALSAADILNHYQVGTNSIRAPDVAAFFLQQPVSATNYHGTTVTFTSLAGGNPMPILYQWYRGTQRVPGATNANYSFTAAYPADDAVTFYVTATNSIGGAKSDVVTLSVLTNIEISAQPYGI